MADDKEKWITYKDDPAGYNKQCYSQWVKLWERFRERNKENVQLANNYSQDLHDRKNDERLSRACLFIPLISPAMWSRIGYMLNLTFAVKEPIEVLPVEEGEAPLKTAKNIKTLIHKYLQKDKFRLTCLEMKMAQELLPISFIKVAELEESKKVLTIETPTMDKEYPQADVKTSPKKVWKSVKGQWRPTCILFTQDAVFYDPAPSKWSEKQFVGTITPLTLGELAGRFDTFGYEPMKEEDGKQVPMTKEEFIQAIKEKGAKWTTGDDWNEEVQTSMGGESKEGTSWGTKYKVLENYHKVEDEDGNISRKITTSTGNLVIWDRDYPYEKLDIPDPFVPVIGYPVLNQVEGMTTADMMKHLQHAVNDFFNIIIDAGKYGIFPPKLRDSQANIVSKQITAPGVEWVVDVPPGKTLDQCVKQLFTITPVGKEFFEIIGVLRELAEIVGGAPMDILSAGVSNPNETATKTVERTKGMNSRLSGINILQDVEIYKRIAYIMWVMTLERLGVDQTYPVEKNVSFGINDLNGEFEFDVPHLSGMAERDLKVKKLQDLLTILQGTPFWAHPAMVPVIYGIIEKISEYSLLTEFSEIFPVEMVSYLSKPVPPAGAGESPGGPLDMLKTIQQGAM